MGEFPVALIFIILSIISSIAKSKKKQEKMARKQAEKQVVVVSPQKKPASSKPAAVPTMSTWDEAERELAPAAPVMGWEGRDACHEYMLPRQEIKPEIKKPASAVPVMDREGADPCHEYMLTVPNAQPAEEITDGISKEQAQELVRGIIFSEIMARPVKRYARRPQ